MSSTFRDSRLHRSARRGLVPAVVAILGLSWAVAIPVAAGSASLTAVRNLVAVAQGDNATVSWQAPATGTAATYVVEAHRFDYYDTNAPDFGARIVGGSVTSIVWPDLPLGDPVYFTVTPVAASDSINVAGALGPYNATGKVTATDSHCASATSGYCVVVDTNAGRNVEGRPGAGLLHGTVPAGNPWVGALNLRQWRIRAQDAPEYRDASAVVPPRNVMEVLSDAWYTATHHATPYAADPWADWNAYQSFIEATVRGAMQAGADPIWDIQNEPGYYPYDPASPPSAALVEMQYLEAYRAIKQVAPDARVIAPSIEWRYDNGSSPADIGMRSFAAFAAANGMDLYALSWHDNADLRDHDPLFYSQMPQALDDQAEVVRALIAANPALGSPELYVNENTSAAGQRIPGFGAGYLAAEDQAGVDEANRSCWNYAVISAVGGCSAPNLGQLLNTDGSPNPNYWVMVDYAAMAGERVGSQVSSVNVSALAVTDGSGVTRLLLGRHQTCSQATTGPASCAGPIAPASSMPTTVKLLLRTGATSADVGVQEIPNTTSDMAKAPATSHTTVPVSGGVATVSLPSFGDGEAFFLTVAPDSSAGQPAPPSQQTNTEVPPPTGTAQPTRALPISGTNQSAMILRSFAAPLVALVTDQYGNPVVGSSVQFALTPGYGHFANGATTATVVTDTYGVATSPAVVAGLLPGQWVASAYLPSLPAKPGAPVAFYALLNTLI